MVVTVDTLDRLDRVAEVAFERDIAALREIAQRINSLEIERAHLKTRTAETSDLGPAADMGLALAQWGVWCQKRDRLIQAELDSLRADHEARRAAAVKSHARIAALDHLRGTLRRAEVARTLKAEERLQGALGPSRRRT